MSCNKISQAEYLMAFSPRAASSLPSHAVHKRQFCEVPFTLLCIPLAKALINGKNQASRCSWLYFFVMLMWDQLSLWAMLQCTILLTRNKSLRGLKENMLIMPVLYCFLEMIESPTGLPSLRLGIHSCHLISPAKRNNMEPAASDIVRLLVMVIIVTTRMLCFWRIGETMKNIFFCFSVFNFACALYGKYLFRLGVSV